VGRVEGIDNICEQHGLDNIFSNPDRFLGNKGPCDCVTRGVTQFTSFRSNTR
jgi:hypothetical protein